MAAGMKRIVVCCDGTWDKARSKHLTNVAKTWLDLEPEGSLEGESATKAGRAADGIEQVVFYEAGVGTSPLLFFCPLVALSVLISAVLVVVFETWAGVLVLLVPFAVRFL